MKKLYILFPILLLTNSGVLFGQTDIDLNGEWNGTINSGLTHLNAQLSVHQKENSLEGYLLQKTLNNKDSVKYAVEGDLDANGIHLEGTKIIYRTMLTCLSLLDLTYEMKDGREILSGRWKGDWRLTTCPPLSTGKLEFSRPVREEPIIALHPVREIRLSDEQEFIGNELTGELLKRNYYALIIGVDQYRDEKIPSLDNPVHDARLLRDVLKTYYTFRDENIIMLENPTRTDIIEQLDAMSSKITDKDQLLVFYAGHGIWEDNLNQGYWLPSDASMNTKAQWLSNSTIRDYIGGIKAKHTLLISDACFSGSIFKERAVYTESKAILEMYKLPSRKAMTSGTLKTVPDKSVFMKYLVKTLEETDQPFVSSGELFRRFKIAVINNSVNGQVPQYGPIMQAGDEGGEFIFLRKQN